MSMSVDIPADLQPLLQAAIANGRYANEQELVTKSCDSPFRHSKDTNKCDTTCKRRWSRSIEVRYAMPISTAFVSSFPTNMMHQVIAHNGTCLLE